MFSNQISNYIHHHHPFCVRLGVLRRSVRHPGDSVQFPLSLHQKPRPLVAAFNLQKSTDFTPLNRNSAPMRTHLVTIGELPF